MQGLHCKGVSFLTEISKKSKNKITHPVLKRLTRFELPLVALCAFGGDNLLAIKNL